MCSDGCVGAAEGTQLGSEVHNAVRGVVDNHTTNFITLTALETFSSLACLCVFLSMKGKLFCAISQVEAGCAAQPGQSSLTRVCGEGGMWRGEWLGSEQAAPHISMLLLFHV